MTSTVQRRWRDDASLVERCLVGAMIVSASILERVRRLPPLRGRSLLLVLASAAAAPLLLTYQAVDARWSELRGPPSQGLVVPVVSWPAWLVAALAAAPPLCVLAMVLAWRARCRTAAAGLQDDLEGQIDVPPGGLSRRRTKQHSQEKLTHEDPSARVPWGESRPR